MKYLVISDIHGSSYYAKKARESGIPGLLKTAFALKYRLKAAKKCAVCIGRTKPFYSLPALSRYHLGTYELNPS